MTTEQLVKEQSEFMDDLAQLSVYITKQSIYKCPGELRRSNDKLPCPHCGELSTRQEQLVAAGRSWTLQSMHLDGLAIDMTLFKYDEDGAFVQISTEEYVEIGRYWELLSDKNEHSLKRGDDNRDIYHFGRRI